MSKEAIIFSIDAGFSMDQKFIDSESTRLKIALQCLKLTLQQKLFNNSSHQIGFALFGQNDGDSDDGNNTLLKPIAKPDLDFVRKVVSLSQITFGNDKPGGDIFSAIDFMTDQLVNHCGTKKYNKRAFLFTNGRGKTNLNQTHFKNIVKEIKKNQIKLNIIPMDFMETYDFQTNEIDDEVFAHPIQQQNSQLLIKLRELCPQNIQIFPASLAIELYKKFRKRDTNPVALYKGNLEIAPNLGIEVCTYKAIRKQKLKSLSKFDLTAPFNPEIKKEKEIEVDINYILEGDGQGNLVDKQNVINAYAYGANIVPMNQAFENEAKIFQSKNFTLLGFVQSQKVPRHCFLGQVDIVVPQKENLISKKLFSAFIYSMLVQKKYAIARYVPRNSKRGVCPKMVVLIPFRSPDRQMFYLTELPTIEGVRDYPFNSLKKSTQKQQELVSNLVDKMMLVNTQNGKEKQEAKIENMFNPYRQYFYQTLFHRVLEEGQQNAIPELDEVTRKYITPETKTFARTENQMPKVKKEFKLKVIQINKNKDKQRKLIVWKDVLAGQLTEMDSFNEISEPISLHQIGKKFTLDTEDDDKFNPSEPIISFRKMINNNKKDLVNEALNEVSAYIQKRGQQSGLDSESTHLIECAKQMRKACIEQREVEFWDEWFERAKLSLNYNLYHLMKINGLGFINKSNEEVYKPDIFEMKPVSLEVDELD